MNLYEKFERISTLGDFYQFIAPNHNWNEGDLKCKFECQIGWLGGRSFILVTEPESGPISLKAIVNKFERLHQAADKEDKKNTVLILDVIHAINATGKNELDKQNILYRVLTYIKQFFGNTLTSYDLETTLNAIFPISDRRNAKEKRAVISLQAEAITSKLESDLKKLNLERLIQKLLRCNVAQEKMVNDIVRHIISKIDEGLAKNEIEKLAESFKNCPNDMCLEIIFYVIAESKCAIELISKLTRLLFPNPNDSYQHKIAQKMQERQLKR